MDPHQQLSVPVDELKRLKTTLETQLAWVNQKLSQAQPSRIPPPQLSQATAASEEPPLLIPNTTEATLKSARTGCIIIVAILSLLSLVSLFGIPYLIY
jgi:hypothetical protein